MKSFYRQDKNAQSTPQTRRMKKLENRERFYQIFFVVNVLLLAGMAYFVANKPSVPILVDYETGQLKGEYRISSHRTTTEMTNGITRFTDWFYSHNSSTVKKDHFLSLQVMTPELRKKRIAYLSKENFVTKTQQAGIRSHNEYSSINIVHSDGKCLRFEVLGKVIFDNVISENVDTRRKELPIHYIVDGCMAGITEENPIGVLVIDYYNYGDRDE